MSKVLRVPVPDWLKKKVECKKTGRTGELVALIYTVGRKGKRKKSVEVRWDEGGVSCRS